MSGWLYDDSSGTYPRAMMPINSTMQQCYAISYEDLELLSEYLTSPTISSSFIQFFKEINNLVTSIKLFPFRIATSNTERKWLKLAGSTVSILGYTCEVGEIDVRKYSSPSLLFAKEILPLGGTTPRYYDFNGYTKLFLFLPFYGEVEILANDVMGKWLKVYYCVSVITGEIIYYITVHSRNTGVEGSMANGRILGKYTTNIAVDIPIGSTNQHDINRNLILNAANAAVTIGTTAASIIGGIPNTASNTQTVRARSLSDVTRKRRLSKDPGLRITNKRIMSDTTTTTGSREVYTPVSRQLLGAFEQVASTAISALNNAMLKVSSEIPKSAALDQFGPHSVKLVIYRPKLLVDFHEQFVGLPLHKTGLVGEYHGASKMLSVFMSEFSSAEANPTLSEIEEIRDILLSGYYNEYITESLDT